MPFKKGQSGNPRGRQRGSLNKSTRALKEFAVDVLDSEQWRDSALKRMIAGKAPHLEGHLLQVLLPKTDKHEHSGSVSLIDLLAPKP